ncbi:MAG TPA: adenosylmethionine decarboxylase [Spirochaetota bacterium]|nr:adenosylmethionine decarboxylase [Spirochaetota bacterium]HPS86595.1 adenosylmethionine decarboxylase [Spirochaetota bacterium]
MNYLGRHFLAEFYNCSSEILNDETSIADIMTKAVEVSKATIIKPFFHKFSPHGISGVIVIAESHLAIHTWPEFSFAAVDLFSCGDFDFTEALRFIRDNLTAEKYSILSIKRGINVDSTSNIPVNHFESQKIYL